MTSLVSIFFILYALAGCVYCLDDSNLTAAQIGGNCERDRDCIEHAFCRVQLTCLCEPYYSPSPDKSMCIATVGLGCSDDSMCRTMANAECKQDLCACKDDFFLDSSNSSNCIRRPVQIGDLCQVNAVCQDTFSNALCISEKCQCFTGYHFTNQTSSCIPNRGLYNSCTEDHECYMDDQSPDVLECKNNECACKEGEPRCDKGSLITAAGTLIMMSLLLQRIAQ